MAGFTTNTCDNEQKKFEENADDGGTDVRVNVHNPSGEPVPVALTPAVVTPTITNLSLPVANTEVDHTLQTNLKKLLIKNRNNGKLQFSFTDTESGTKFITIYPGASYQEDNINYASGTLSIQSNKASQTVEIMEWA